MNHDARGVLTLNIPDGRTITAPTGVWFLALYDLMSHHERVNLFERLIKIRGDNDKNSKLDELREAEAKASSVSSFGGSGGAASVPVSNVPDNTYDDDFLKSCMISPMNEEDE